MKNWKWIPSGSRTHKSRGYMSSRHFNLESNEIRLSSTPLRGATVAVSVLGKLNMPLLLDPRFFVPMGWLALGAWRYCQTSLFHYTIVTLEHEKDSQWDSNPHAKYPQVPHFMGGVEPPEVAQLDTPIEGARLSISPWEIEKSFSKEIYHGLDNTGQLLPRCFLSQIHEHVYLLGHMGCSKPIAGYLPRLSMVVLLTPQSISRYLWFKFVVAGCRVALLVKDRWLMRPSTVLSVVEPAL